MNSSLTAAEARSCRARKIPEMPPAVKSETKPMANSMAVLSCTRAFHSVPSQQIKRIAAGRPSEEARSEKTSGENGFMPLENICWPQTQKPKTPTPHKARTTRRSIQTGLRENVGRNRGRLARKKIYQRKKMRAPETVRQQADGRGEENAENQRAQNSVDEPGPHRHGQPRQGHAVGAEIDGGDAAIDAARERGSAEERDAGDPDGDPGFRGGQESNRQAEERGCSGPEG